MEKLFDLKEKLCEELEEYSRKPDVKAGDLEVIHKLTDTIKNIDKIVMLEDEEMGGYSSANRGKHYVRGHYSRADGRDGYSREGDYSRDGRNDMMHDGGYSSRRRDSRGRYSRADGRSEMMEHLEMAVDFADEKDRETIKRFMKQLENA